MSVDLSFLKMLLMAVTKDVNIDKSIVSAKKFNNNLKLSRFNVTYLLAAFDLNYLTQFTLHTVEHILWTVVSMGYEKLDSIWLDLIYYDLFESTWNLSNFGVGITSQDLVFKTLYTQKRVLCLLLSINRTVNPRCCVRF